MNYTYRILIFKSIVNSTKVYDSNSTLPITLEHKGAKKNSIIIACAIADYLSRLGSTGWELISSQDKSENETWYILKRRAR